MSKDTSIAAQTAAKAAAKLYAGSGNPEGAMIAMARFYKGIIQLGGDPEVAAQQQYANAQANMAQAGVQATVSVDLSTEDARWRDALVNRPGDWYNNVGDTRATSGGGNGPDFKFKDDNADVKALFLNGKYGPAPAWVFEHLGLPMPGSGQATASAPHVPPAEAPF